MKIFDSESGFENKVNFVDENNVYVGYDLSISCCEYADWFISNTITPVEVFGTDFEKGNCFRPEDAEINYSNLTKHNLDLYKFDTTFFQSIYNDNIFDSGSMAVFRITDGTNEKFLHIFNSHNGYYSHGFEFKNNDLIIEQGRL
jgi:hypothetical protein